MTSIRTALVIGSGITGPVAAMALQKAGIDSVIYEAHLNRADGIGVFMTVASNGIDALRVLEADKVILAAGFPTPAITLRSSTGKRLGESRTGGRLPDGTASHSIKRSDLYQALRDEAITRGIRVEHGKRLVGAQETGDGVRATFADGSEAFGDVLIGCDGVHSALRRIIDPAAPAPTYSGLLNTGGYARGVRVDTEPGHYEMIFGKRGFFGYVVAPAGDVWWFANIPRRDEPIRDEMAATTGTARRQRLFELYAGDAGPAIALIRATPDISTISAIHTVGHLPHWHRGRMVVIGDAAHAPSPTSGQGASLAIEDAVILAKNLRDLSSPDEAFAAFEAQRRPRVERIIRWAARINNSKAAGPIGRSMRDAMMPLILKLTADSRTLRRTYDFHIDWDIPATAIPARARTGS